VDDYEAWRRFVCSTLQEWMKLYVVVEAADGLAGLWKAQELQPDLVILDIGLPKLNGIEVARRILKSAPDTKILFVSEQRSSDIVEEALRTGARGYVVKSDAALDLVSAVRAVLEDKRFVSASLAGVDSSDSEDEHAAPHTHQLPLNHEVGFYQDDSGLLDDLTSFVRTALDTENAAIVLATESHRRDLLQRLRASGVSIDAMIREGRYVSLDAAEALSRFMVQGVLDPVRSVEAFRDLILAAGKGAKRERPRVAIFGECVHLLWSHGNIEATMQFETIGNQLTRSCDVDILCGYSLGSVSRKMDNSVFQRICMAHSAVRSTV
jgi:DNA-binding NarL/FixJ family response regulator